ncbi:MAG TPA: hypothetical protein VM925_36080, partial [Labilithrix sp.]|nr:hypothetical protein [Labilithrix sp.]
LRSTCDQERDALKSLLGRRIRRFDALASAHGLRHPRYTGGFFVTVFTAEGMALARRLAASDVFVVPLRGAVRLALSAVATRDVERLVSAIALHAREARSSAELSGAVA